ncbi:MAG: UDP-N-acetylglucosamine 2-epimerase [Pseudomonadota bacterium]
MNKKKKICVFSGTRAEYGLLNPLIQKIKADACFDLCLIVSGTHLSPEFGMTFQQIEADGVYIDEKIEILVSSDSPSGVCKSLGLGLIQFTDAITRLNPDMMVLLGDRYETFAMAVAAVVNTIPIAHIHGGESTVGAIDESFRHAITKMSHLHFTCAEPYRDRVIQLGEHPDRVFNVGALGVENIKTMSLLSKQDFYQQMGFDRGDAFFLVTYHPVTLEGSKTARCFDSLLEALSSDRFKDFKIILTKANADKDGRLINQRIDDFVEKNQKRAMAFDSMGQLRYLSAMQYCTLVIGNSSSGIIEAPGFKVPVVNIGNRQKGRIKAMNIIDCEDQTDKIVQAVQTGLSTRFKNLLVNMESPFEKPSTSSAITDILKTVNLSDIQFKEFYDYT